ncbi:hypothetical protein BGW38_009498 [Lunasporangiospora selenospora]|uniref:INO80 complex subunit E N-terminal domain-containing protein n=1 Tax=Lunasporangiospora selenospora TaxID=979761 RepID=A0A9P6FXS8_9FUNG|nr:hypothetical protein BGW38_009498 [Lunasporangiospora selenospora]
MHTASPLPNFSTFESSSTTSTSTAASTSAPASTPASTSIVTSKDKEQVQKHIVQSQGSDETTMSAQQLADMTQSTLPSSTTANTEKSKHLHGQSNGENAHQHQQRPQDYHEKGPNHDLKMTNGNVHDSSSQEPRGDQDGDVHMDGQSQESPALLPSTLPPQSSRSTAKGPSTSSAKASGKSRAQQQHMSPKSNRSVANSQEQNQGLESAEENDGEHDDFDMDVDTPLQPSDEKYKRLKRKLKEVLEENDRMSQELDKTYRRVRNLRKEKNLLLDRLCVLERRSLDSGSDSLSSLSSDSDSSDSSLDIVQTRRTSPVRVTGPKVARLAATGGAQQAARSATSSSAPASSQTHHPKKTTAKGPGQSKGTGNGAPRESRPTTTSTPSTITNVGSATQKPKRLHNPNKLRPSLLKVRKVQALEKDENGRVKLPVTIGILTILDTGYVVYDREAFHNERYIWPVGYRMKRLYNSMINPSEQTTYTCSVIDDGEAPKFQIDAEDQPGKPIIAGTATGAWTHVVKAANLIRKRDHSNSASGPDYYGFSNATIAKMIQDLPNADKCPSYIMQRFEEPSSASIERRKAVMAMAANSSKTAGAGSTSATASGSGSGVGAADSGTGTGTADGAGAGDEEGMDEDEEGAEDDRDDDGNDDDENEDNDEGDEEEEGDDDDEMYTSLGSVGDKQRQTSEETLKVRRAGFEPPFANTAPGSSSYHAQEGDRPSGTNGPADELDVDDEDDGIDVESRDGQGDDDDLTDSDSETVERRRTTTSGTEVASEQGPSSSASSSSAPLTTPFTASGGDGAVSAGAAVHSIATLGENRSPIVVTTADVSGASSSLAGTGGEVKGDSEDSGNGERSEPKVDNGAQSMDVDLDVDAGKPISS